VTAAAPTDTLKKATSDKTEPGVDMDNPERVRALMTARFAEVERLAASIPQTQRKLAEIRVTQTSDDGLVTVTVDLRGRLRELHLDPRIYRVPDADELAETIVAQTTQAGERASAAGEAILRDLLPRTSDLAVPDIDLDTLLGRTTPSAPGEPSRGHRRA
jgi:DNA-binding protein YbaB